MRPIHMVGLLLWRGGLLLTGAWALYAGARLVLRFVDMPVQLEIGGALVLAGLALLLLSLVIERIRDAAEEGPMEE